MWVNKKIYLYRITNQYLSDAFKMYDLDDDDLISKNELLAILHMMVGANISDEQLTSIAERTISEADEDGDQMISFEEFCKALQRTDVEQKMSIRFLNWFTWTSGFFKKKIIHIDIAVSIQFTFPSYT